MTAEDWVKSRKAAVNAVSQAQVLADLLERERPTLWIGGAQIARVGDDGDLSMTSCYVRAEHVPGLRAWLARVFPDDFTVPPGIGELDASELRASIGKPVQLVRDYEQHGPRCAVTGCGKPLAPFDGCWCVDHQPEPPPGLRNG